MKRLVYLNHGLTVTPGLLRRLVDRVDPSRYDERLAPDRFSLREVVAHMADLEPVMRGRMELALAHPGSPVENFDEDKEAVAKNYAAWEVSPTLDRFAAERQATLALFGSLSDDQRRQTIVHPVLGNASVEDLAVFCLGHDTYHIDQVSQYLRC